MTSVKLVCDVVCTLVSRSQSETIIWSRSGSALCTLLKQPVYRVKVIFVY